MKDASSEHGILLHTLFALTLLGLGVLVGVMNPLWVIGVLLSIPVGILSALYWKSKIAYLYLVFYAVGYAACRFYLGYMAWRH